MIAGDHNLSLGLCKSLLGHEERWLLPVKGNEEGPAHERSMLQRNYACCKEIAHAMAVCLPIPKRLSNLTQTPSVNLPVSPMQSHQSYS